MPKDPDELDPLEGDPSAAVVNATTADGDEVPDTSGDVDQSPAPVEGSPE